MERIRSWRVVGYLGVGLFVISRIADVWSFFAQVIPDLLARFTGMTLPDLADLWGPVSWVLTVVGIALMALAIGKGGPRRLSIPSHPPSLAADEAASDSRPSKSSEAHPAAHGLGAHLQEAKELAPVGKPASLAIRPVTKREVDHRWPVHLVNEPEGSQHRVDFCRARDRLIKRGLALLEELSLVSTSAGHLEQRSWDGKLGKYRVFCKNHHAIWWAGVNYSAAGKVGPPVPPPVWRGPNRDRIVANLAWVIEHGWGCDEVGVTTVTKADDARNARKEISEFVEMGLGFAEQLRGLPLDPDAPEPRDGEAAGLLSDASEWVDGARKLDAYWFPVQSGLLGVGMAEKYLKSMATSDPVRQPVWRQQAVHAVENELRVLESRL